jgi:16S rRNA (uracil1498-N3)-methyltransferase
MDVGSLIYLLLDGTPNERVTLKGENFKYLIKVRRQSVGDVIKLRYRETLSNECQYKILSIDGRSLELELLGVEFKEVKSLKPLHIAWCIIESKSIEKVLPSLSEIGVTKISFISCERSQKVKLDFKRFERILEASMQQCGRTTYIEFDTYRSLSTFSKDYPDTKVFDFCENILGERTTLERVLIGCEGGFSDVEKKLLASHENFRLDTPMVLRSESAVMAVASKILL